MKGRRRSLVGAQLASWMRAGEGARSRAVGARPALPLELYEFEACPFCRRVREALTRLDLDVLVRPCPKGGTRHRGRLLDLGGKEQFPFLVDPNTGRSMYESADIVAYLDAHYGGPPDPARATEATFIRSTLALIASGVARGTAGSRARPARAAAEPLILEGFEADPESRLVREILCELELAYYSRITAPGSARRVQADASGAARSAQGRPRLIDPNTGSSPVGFAAIAEHLESTYALDPRPA